MKLPKFERLIGWSPTKLADWDECPLRAQLKHGVKLCPCCFEEQAIQSWDKSITAPDGVVIGPETAYCSKKGEVIPKAKPLANGIALGGSLERFIDGRDNALDKKISHPTVLRIAAKLRAQFKKGLVKVEAAMNFTEGWTQELNKFAKGVWLRTKLDVLRTGAKKGLVEVIDWKTGGIDKRTGQIRASEKYDDQLSIYTTAALTADPGAARAEASLVFIEAPHSIDPVVARESCDLKRKDLPKAQKKWSLRVVAMLNDETFAPRPGFYCGWCDYSKERGGPCPVA